MHRPKCRAACVVCLALLLAARARGEEPLAPAKPGPVVRAAVPPAEKLAAAEKELKSIYKTEYAKPDAASRAALAKELRKQAPAVKDDLAALYVMLRDAREFAATGRDVETALAAAKVLGERFEVDAGELKTASFTTIARSGLPPEDAEKAFAAGLDLLEELERSDQFENVERVAQGLDGLARVAKSPALVSQASDRLKEIRARQLKWQQVKSHLARLKEKPDDPQANLAVGRYYAEAKKDFPKALPFLAKGADPALKALAEKDLANPTDLDGRVAVGDAWWEAGEKETGTLKSALRLRAVFWYEQIVDNLTGLKKAVVQKRIDQAFTVALAAVRPLPITWKEGVIRTVKAEIGKSYGGFVPASGLAFGKRYMAGTPVVYEIYDLEVGAKIREISEATLKISPQSECPLPDGRTLLVAGPAGQGLVYVSVGLITGEVSAPKPFPFQTPAEWSWALDPDGEAVIAGVDKGQYVLIRLRDGARLGAPVPPLRRAMRWFPERREIAGCDGEEVVVFDALTGKRKRSVGFGPDPKATRAYSFGTFSPDGNLLLMTGIHDNGFWHGLLDAHTGKWLQSLPLAYDGSSAKNPRGTAFTANGRCVAGSCMDGVFRVWEARTWKQLYALPGAERFGGVSSDGRFALAFGGGELKLIGLPKSVWPGAAN